MHTSILFLLLADLSKNRLTEIPPEVCLFAPLESLNLYHNCIKCIPEAIINLQMLTYLDIRWAIANTILLLLFQTLIEYKRSECWYSVICQKSAGSPFTLLTGWKCSRERDVSSFATTQFPVTIVSVLHASVCCFKCRSLFCLSLQPKSSNSVAEVPFQPSPEGFACEQQQACVHPWRDWQGQRLNGTGEQPVYISLYIQYSAWGTYTRDEPVFCLHITENLSKNQF